MVRQAAKLAALLTAMRESPVVPDDWEVALNLSQSAVQSLLQSDWKRTVSATDERSLVWVAPAEVNGEHDIIEVKTALAPPAVGLSASDQSVSVHFGIDSGTFQIGKAPAALVVRSPNKRVLLASGGVSWSDPVVITKQSPLQLAGAIPMKVQSTDHGFSVGLSFADGSLTLASKDAGGISSAQVKQSMESWVAAQKLSGQIAKLAFPPRAAATVVTPAHVTARVVTSLGGNPLLQILTGAVPGRPVPAASAPVPHPDTHDFSLMVSSKATMAMIASAYNLGTGVVKLVSAPPQDDQQHWFAQVHEPMVFRGSFGRQDGTVYLTDHAKLYMRFGGSTDQGLQLFTHIDPSSTVQLKLDLAAHYPTAIMGAGAEQVVGLTDGAHSLAAHGFYETIVQPQLEAFLTGPIKSDMSKVRLTALSDLVLRDLTLSGHRLRFEVSALPAELLIAGSLVPNA